MPQSAEFELRIENDPPFWIHHQVVPIDNGVAVTSRDTTARRREEIDTRTSRNFLQSLINNLPLLISLKSMREADFGRLLIWNQAAEDMTDYRADQVAGKREAEAFAPGASLSNEDEDRAMADTPMVMDVPERELLRQDGSRRYLHTISVPLFDGDGAVEYLLCIAEDVTPRRAQERELQDAIAALRESGARLRTVADALPAMIAYVDSAGVCRFHNIRQEITAQYREKKRLIQLTQLDALTGLTNRAGFMQKLDDAMHSTAQQHTLMGVMYMDIDHFKPVNDTHGHNTGDALLRAFSARLTPTLRASDTVARLGGDEFHHHGKN